MTEPNEREAARAKYVAEIHIEPLTYNEVDIFDSGFDAGYAAGQPQWIAVSERLPEQGKPVLWFIKLGDDLFRSGDRASASDPARKFDRI